MRSGIDVAIIQRVGSLGSIRGILLVPRIAIGVTDMNLSLADAFSGVNPPNEGKPTIGENLREKSISAHSAQLRPAFRGFSAVEATPAL